MGFVKMGIGAFACFNLMSVPKMHRKYNELQNAVFLFTKQYVHHYKRVISAAGFSFSFFGGYSHRLAYSRRYPLYALYRRLKRLYKRIPAL